jgi:hypothetical protein
MDQLNNTLKNSFSNLSNKMYEVNLTLQETASDMDSLNNSLGKISSSKSGSKKILLGTGPVAQEHTFMPVC